MANIKQIVYNLADWQYSGGYISTSKNLSTIVRSHNDEGEVNKNYETNKIDIFNNIFDGKIVKKVGIQAAPGTQFIISDSKNIDESLVSIIGRSGIYELNENINIQYLKFIKPSIYDLDTDQTNYYLKAGMENLVAAEANRRDQLDDLKAQYGDKYSENPAYWTDYSKIQEEYLIKYNNAVKIFQLGVNGIYVKKGQSDLHNIIIDYIEEDEVNIVES